ncbi:hypothetical protein K474DRAFT_913990 [Panus rudis PR-1116 ss-1]|nr:hypothetical protein K474DRAFT_913990 [Panus rudis PR-1116 ss-1]
MRLAAVVRVLWRSMPNRTWIKTILVIALRMRVVTLKIASTKTRRRFLIGRGLIRMRTYQVLIAWLIPHHNALMLKSLRRKTANCISQKPPVREIVSNLRSATLGDSDSEVELVELKVNGKKRALVGGQISKKVKYNDQGLLSNWKSTISSNRPRGSSNKLGTATSTSGRPATPGQPQNEGEPEAPASSNYGGFIDSDEDQTVERQELTAKTPQKVCLIFPKGSD